MNWYKFQPFSTTKDLGKEYNAHCQLVPNSGDWILILDYDCMILCADTYHVIENAIQAYPDTAVFGALTNRVAYHHQRISPMSDNDSIKHHIQIAKERAKLYPSECEPVKNVAGFFMLFRKSYWENVPFQDKIVNEFGYLFDRHFCLQARKSNLPIRLIKGAYVWHSYRIDKNYRDRSHLQEVTS
jgi:GT2 family glycosyltransferase